MAIPSGAEWRPDPSGLHQYRYFNGRRWTEHVADDGRQSQDTRGLEVANAGLPGGSGPRRRAWYKRPWVLVAGGIAAVVIVASAGGSSDTHTTDTQTVTVAAKPATTTAAKKHRAKAAHARAARVAAGYRTCDENIQAKRATTSCGFAKNVFYTYATHGDLAAAYSPATKIRYAVACHRRTQVVCRTTDGAVIKFPAWAATAYTSRDARRYAAHADLGPSAAAAQADHSDTAPTPAPSAPDTSSTPPGDNIPNYDNGNGYRVQCNDGTYSQSGGIQGACSHHGGVSG